MLNLLLPPPLPFMPACVTLGLYHTSSCYLRLDRQGHFLPATLFELFKYTLQHCLSETTDRHKSALSRLLTLEFQTFLSATPDL